MPPPLFTAAAEEARGDSAASASVRPLLSPVADPALLRRVLIVKLSSLGDVVHALPLAEALRAGLGPDAQIAWAVKRRFADLLCGNPHLSAVYELKGSGAGDILAFGKTLRAGEQRFDAALDAQGLFVSGAVTRLSGARLRIGLDRNREGNTLFLTHPVVPSRRRAHMVDKVLGFCDALGVPRVAPRPQTYLARSEASQADELLSPARSVSGPIIGFIVGASTADKAWPVERWTQTARLLSDQGARIVLLGGPAEKDAADAILRDAGGAAASNLTGETGSLRTLAAILARCAVVVGGDSGPMHLAVAVGTPVVGLYGVTDPARTGPDWGPSPSVTLDFAEQDAPPEMRRPRHATLADALARIPAQATASAVLSLLAPGNDAGGGKRG